MRTYVQARTEPEIEQVMRKRYLNTETDSFNRLFGTPDGNRTQRSKPNYMQSDILGTGAVQQPQQRRVRISDGVQRQIMIEREDDNQSFQSESEQIEEDVTDSRDEMEASAAAVEAVSPDEEPTIQEETPEETASQNEGSTNGNAGGAEGGDDSSLASNARENGGNPILGTGYRQECPHRRRQFEKTQNMLTSFW